MLCFQLFLVSCIRAVSSFHRSLCFLAFHQHLWCEGCQSGSRTIIVAQMLSFCFSPLCFPPPDGGWTIPCNPPKKSPQGIWQPFPPFFPLFWVTGELLTRQLMKVLNEPDLSPNNGLENVSQIDQSMASKPPSQGQAKDLTSHENRARRVMTPVP